MKVEKCTLRAPFSFQAPAFALHLSGFTHHNVIPNGAEGPARDLTSDAAIPAVNGIAGLNFPPPDVMR
jgi:hypothetical protein